MSAIKQLHSVEDLNQFVGENGKRLLFKHSNTCPISGTAHEEFEAYVKGHEVPAAVIVVQEDRPLSNEVAERYGIKHESPQIFLMENGEVKWHTSHWKITQASIEEAVKA